MRYVSKINIQKKIIQKIISIVLFVVMSVGIFFYQVTDKNAGENLEVELQERTTLAFETDTYLSDIHIVSMEQMTGLQMQILLLDEHGYYLYESISQMDGETDFDFNVRKKLHAGEKYDMQIVLTESDGEIIQDASCLTQIRLQLYGYEHLPLFISIFVETVLLCCLLLALAYINQAKVIENFQNKIKCWGSHTNQPVKGEYIIVFLLFTGIAVSFMYGDTKAFVYYIFDFWDSIFEGNVI